MVLLLTLEAGYVEVDMKLSNKRQGRLKVRFNIYYTVTGAFEGTI